jgi:hypothetical protein
MVRYELINTLILSKTSVSKLIDFWQLNREEINLLKVGRKS